MATDKPAYRPLGGKGRAAFSVAVAGTYRLYLGSDHLLYVCNERFSESYKRFYFRDIQALVLSQTARRNTFNIILLCLTAGTLFLSWAVGATAGAAAGWWMAGLFLLIFGTPFVLNNALGPTCTCYVKTAVDNYEVTSLKRVRTAYRVFDDVNPLIIAAQGAFPPEELQAKVAESAIGGTAPAPLAKPAIPLRHETGRYHALLFGALLMDCAVTSVDFVIKNLGVTLSSTLLTFVLIGLLVTALIRQQNSDIRKPLRAIVWGTLGYIALILGLGYVHNIIMSLESPGLESNQWEWLKLISAASPWDSPLLLISYLTSIVGSFVLGVGGFVALRNHRRATEPPCKA